VPLLFIDMFDPIETLSIYALDLLEIRAHCESEIHANLTESEFKNTFHFWAFLV
jgi:SOS response regulatory protein OraA/RecX